MKAIRWCTTAVAVTAAFLMQSTPASAYWAATYYASHSASGCRADALGLNYTTCSAGVSVSASIDTYAKCVRDGATGENLFCMVTVNCTVFGQSDIGSGTGSATCSGVGLVPCTPSSSIDNTCEGTRTGTVTIAKYDCAKITGEYQYANVVGSVGGATNPSALWFCVTATDMFKA